jgi:diguanylate cyclase (GGDEF)-like protein
MCGEEQHGDDDAVLRDLAMRVACAPGQADVATAIADALVPYLNGPGVGVALSTAEGEHLAVAGPFPRGCGAEARASLQRALAAAMDLAPGSESVPGVTPCGSPRILVPIAQGEAAALCLFGTTATLGKEAVRLGRAAAWLAPVLAARSIWVPRALRDPLTGLYNRRWLDEALEQALAAARRRRQEVSLIMMDLAGFKSVNDAIGHVEGDACLRRVAATLRQQVRREDGVCRYGGDEFVALLPQTTPRDARCVAARLVDAVGALPRIALDAGVAGSGTGEATLAPAALLDAADRALREARDVQPG